MNVSVPYSLRNEILVWLAQNNIESYRTHFDFDPNIRDINRSQVFVKYIFDKEEDGIMFAMRFK